MVHYLLLLTALLGLPVPAAAADTAAPAQNLDSITFTNEMWDPNMLQLLGEAPEVIPPLNRFDGLLPPPPANSSAETRAELDALLKMQAEERTPEQVALAVSEAHFTNYHSLFGLIASQTIANLREFPITLALLEDVNNDMSRFLVYEKHKFMRPRPYLLDPRITISVPYPGHPAYPSGHAAQSWAGALLLSMIDPPRTAAYHKQAYDNTHRRELSGVHYPSDSVAGKKLAEAAVPAFLAVPSFATRVEEAKAEFARIKVIPRQKD